MTSLLKTLLLAVCIWIQQVYAQEVDLKILKTGPAKLATYNESSTSFKVTISPEALNAKFVFIEIATTNLLEISHGHDAGSLFTACTATGKTTCVFRSEEIRKFVESPQGYKIVAKVTGDNADAVKNYSLGIGADNFVPFLSDHEHKMVLHKIDKLVATTTIKSKPDTSKLRLQVRAHTGSEFTSLRAFVNFNKQEAPTSTTHDAELEHIDSHRVGLISTKSEQLFCGPSGSGKTEADCKYTLAIEGEDMHSLDITLTQAPAREDIVTERTYLDRTRAGGDKQNNIYRITLADNQFVEKDIKVSLVSLEGKSNLYVHPEIVPEFVNMSLWKEERGVSKSIVIPFAERTTAFQKIKTLYIMVSSPQGSTYYLRLFTKDASSDTERLTLAARETFFTEYNKLKNFKLEITRIGTDEESEDKLTHVTVDLHSQNSHINIYGHLLTPGSKELLTAQVVTSAVPDQNFAHYQNDTTSHDTKQLKFSVHCDSKHALRVIKLPHGLKEFTCELDIGVMPVKASQGITDGQKTTEEAKKVNKVGAIYEIVYNLDRTHIVLHENYLTNLRLMPNEKKLLQFIHVRKEKSAEPSTLDLSIQMFYGRVQVMVSKTAKDPCNATSGGLIVNRPIGGSINQAVILASESSALYGSFFICIQTFDISSFMGLSIEAKFPNEAKVDIQRSLRNIPPNQQLIGEIESGAKPLLFSFHATLNKEDQESIAIHLNPLKGNSQYRICVTNNGITPSPSQPYWNVIGNQLIIQSTDSMYKVSAEYIVSISVSNPKSMSGTQKFTVSYSFSSKQLLLRQGYPHTGNLDFSNKKQVFRLEIPHGTDNLTILKQIHEGNVNFKLLNATEATSENSTGGVYMTNNLGGQYLTRADLNQKCHDLANQNCFLHVSVETLSASSRFTLAFAADGNPFYLAQDIVLTIPALINEKATMHLVHEIPVETADRFEFRCENYFNPYECFLKFVPTLENQKYPTNDSNDLHVGAGTDFVEITKDKFGQNSFMLVTIKSQNLSEGMKYFSFMNQGDYNFMITGQVGALHGMPTLKKGKPVRMDIQNGNWSYFKLHHYSRENIFLQYEGQMCNLFVSKGVHGKADSNNTLVRSYYSTQKNVVIRPDMLKAEESIQGTYFVSIYCPSGGHFGLLYNAEGVNTLELMFNQPVNIDAKVELNQYFTFFNYGESADIYVTYKAAKAKLKFFAKAIKPEELISPDRVAGEMPLPSPENNDFKLITNHTGGLGNFVINKSSSSYCAYCKYVVLMMVDVDDRVEITIRKRLPNQFSRLEDGIEQFGELGRGEVDSYMLIFPPSKTGAGLELQVLQGNVSLHYAQDTLFLPNQTTTIHQWQKQEFFRIHMTAGTLATPYTWRRSFIKIEGQTPASKYIINFIDENMVMELNPQIRKKGYLASAYKKTFYVKTTKGDHVEVIFSLNEIYNDKAMDFDTAHKNLPNFVKLFSVNDLNKVFGNRYIERIDTVRSDIFNREIRYSFKALANYTVIKVQNRMDIPAAFSIEVIRGREKVLLPNHNSVERLTWKRPSAIYTIPIEEANQVVTMDIHQCMQNMKATYSFTPLGGTAEKEQVLYDVFYNLRIVRSPDRGTLSFKFFIDKPANGSHSIDDGSQDLSNKKKYPTVFNMRARIHTEGSHSKFSQQQFHADNNAGDISVLSLDGRVQVNKLRIDDLENLLVDHSVFINYTLYLSDNEGMLNHYSRCEGFAIDSAEKYFNTKKHYSFSQTQLITLESYRAEQKTEEDKLIQVKNPFDNYITFKPTTYGFGEKLKAGVIANILVFPKQKDLSTFPQGEQFIVNYGQFEYGADYLGVTYAAFVVLCALIIAFAVLAFCIKCGIIRPLLKRRMLDFFSTDVIADQLVIEVSDYRKAALEQQRKKQQEDQRSADSSVADLDQTNRTENL